MTVFAALVFRRKGGNIDFCSGSCGNMDGGGLYAGNLELISWRKLWYISGEVVITGLEG
jgi:hypothetical protein